jgi:predicted  nucleic acid-binding Zn-ribbon protein
VREVYPLLREIQSRLLMREVVRQELEQFQARINAQLELQTRREEELLINTQQRKQVELENKQLEVQLHTTSEQIIKMGVDQFTLKDPSSISKSNQQLADLKQLKVNLEEKIYSNMELLENLENEIPKIKKFIEGVQISIKEMEHERDQLKANKSIELTKNAELLQSAVSGLPPSQGQTVKSLINNQPTGKILTAIINGKQCGNCHMHIPPAVGQELDKFKAIIKCQTCGLILIPNT